MMLDKVNTEFAQIAATVRAATVRVHDARERGFGSGIVWDCEGTIVSNAHVVRGTTATIEWEDGRRVRADVVARDDRLDLAVLQLRERLDADIVVIRASRSIVPGELSIAAGNPYGLYGVVTAGLVQRCNSRWVIADVRLAPGNSGGPLADAWGRVIGVNAMIARGLAVAIASDAVSAFVRASRAPEGSRAA